MALEKSDLYTSIWASCDQLRGGMDASQYKDYHPGERINTQVILPLIDANVRLARTDFPDFKDPNKLKQVMTQELLTGRTRLI